MPTQTAYRFRSGDMCIHAGRYSYDGYVDRGGMPMPRLSEMAIHVRGGERFPRVGKTDSPCWWVLLEADDPEEEGAERMIAEGGPVDPDE
jgi:hypothetical protein